MHEGSHSTFAMASRSCTLYAGVTGNLQKRVFEHKDVHDCEPADCRWIEWTPEKQLQILPLRVRMTTVAKVRPKEPGRSFRANRRQPGNHQIVFPLQTRPESRARKSRILPKNSSFCPKSRSF